MQRRTLLNGLAAASITPFVGVKEAMTNPVPPTEDFVRPVLIPHRRRLAMSVAPTTADGFTQLFQDKNDLTWSGGDQCTTFKYNGFTYWLFGDNILGTETAQGGYAPGWQMIPNSILLQDGNTFSTAMANDSIVAVPNPATHTDANSERYWIQGMFAANGHLYVLCQRVTSVGFDFKLAGCELAKFKVNATTGKLTFYGMFVTPSTGKIQDYSTAAIQWCGDAVKDDDGYIYFYGTTLAKDNGFVAHWSYVARVTAGSVENPFAWRFYKKSTGTWVTTIAELNPDVTNGPDALVSSQISSVRKIGGKYIMLHKPWNGLGNAVVMTTSPTPYGPWSTGVTVISSPAGTFEGKNYITYTPQLHPEQVLDSGKVLVSVAWNFNGGTLADIASNADLYKPRFYEIVV